MTDDLFYFREEAGDDDAVTAPPTRRNASVDTLAAFTLEASLAAPIRRRIARADSYALVLEVPSAEWVRPIRAACVGLGDWSVVFARSGESRTEDRPDQGNHAVARYLAEGGRVLGVSQDSERYLPSALLAAADSHHRIAAPSNAVVARVIRAATGRTPRGLPSAVAAGLGIWDLCAAIRVGSAQACVERLAAASAARSGIVAGVAGAVPYEELCGYGEAHAWGTRLLADLEAWRHGRIPFQALDRCAVLASPPGMGKTTYVQALARAGRLPLITSPVSSWLSQSNGYLDGVLKHINQVFDEAYSQAPSILFLDEVDSIPSRSSMDSRNSAWWTPVVTHVLLKLDECGRRDGAGVCVIGATNHPQRLDAALLRPGRLGRVIHIVSPSAPELAAIVRQHLGPDLPDVDLAVVAELGLGASGAQVVGWVGEARARARAAGRQMVAGDLLDTVAPPDTRTPGERMRSALHEAGHAVGAEILGAGEVEQVDLILRQHAAGRTNMRGRLGPLPTRDALERVVVSLLCGRAAETVMLGEPSAGAGGDAMSDLAQATAYVAGIHGTFGLGNTIVHRGAMADVVRALASDPGLRAAVEADLDRLREVAERLIAEHRDIVRTVAEALLDRRVLSGDALRGHIAAARPAMSREGGARQ